MGRRAREPLRALFPDWDLPGTPELPYFSFDVGETLAKACARVQPHFPEADFSGVGVWIVEQDTLARIFRDERAIFLHGILNHPQTPEEVIEFILCHELLHLVIPSREVDGHMTSHPPEFQAMEARVYPRGGIVWAWLHITLGLRLKKDKKQQRILVKRGWKRDLQRVRLPLDKFIEWHIPKHLMAGLETSCGLD